MAGGEVSGEAYGLILDTLSFLLTALLPWLARLVAGRRTVVHDLVRPTGAGTPTWYACRILRRRVLGVDTDVTVRLSRPLQDDVDHDVGDGLHLTGSRNGTALQIRSGSSLLPRFPYYVKLPIDDVPTELLPSDRRGGLTLVRKDEWTTRMRRVRWFSGVVAGLLAVVAVLAYLGWGVTPTPDSVVSSIGAAAALVAGTPGLRASRTLEQAEAWFRDPPVSS